MNLTLRSRGRVVVGWGSWAREPSGVVRVGSAKIAAIRDSTVVFVDSRRVFVVGFPTRSEESWAVSRPSSTKILLESIGSILKNRKKEKYLSLFSFVTLPIIFASPQSNHLTTFMDFGI
jgi:hypothetical protein